MKPDDLQQRIEDTIEEARKIANQDISDAMEVDRMDAELTSLMSNANLLRVRYEAQATRWKVIAQSCQEMARSMRRIHESLNTEKRFTR